MLFSIYLVQIVYLSFELLCEKNENKQKEAGIGPFFNNNVEFLCRLTLTNFLSWLPKAHKIGMIVNKQLRNRFLRPGI